MVATAAAIDDRPSAFRYPRGEGVGVDLPEAGVPLEIGRGRILREGTKVALLSFGGRLQECLAAARGARRRTACRRRSPTPASPSRSTPTSIDRLAREHEVLITVEEGAVGGFGSHVLNHLAASGALDRGLKVRPLAMPDRFVDHDKPERSIRGRRPRCRRHRRGGLRRARAERGSASLRA